jgi:GR25 family glycosyltransferase involved in LPS biosynthesis
MKSYVITIMDMPKSVESAERCIRSMPDYDIEMFPAITPESEPEKIAESLGINLDFFRYDGEKYSRRHRCISAFLSHYSLWKKCVEENEEYQIFEHDAVAVNNLPKFINYKGCISIGAPSYGKFNTPRVLGVNPLTSKRYFPGAHAYRIKPNAAKLLCEVAADNAAPTDVFLNLSTFDWLEEYYPWPVVAKDSFSTIQNVNGCIAKHGYTEGKYELL